MAVLALGIVYQKEVGSSLIWMGETMSGKTKASTVVPADKPAADSAAPLPTTKPEVAPAATKNTTGAAADSTDPTAADMKDAEALAKGEPVAPATHTQQPATNGTIAPGVSDRSVSALDRQNAAESKPEPNWSETDSIETLWGAVQAGSVSAEVSLAERFARGAGVNKNCDQAKILMKAAANKGNREARLRLYELESNGCQ